MSIVAQGCDKIKRWYDVGNGLRLGILARVEDDELLPVQTVADELGVKRWAVWNYIKKHGLQARKVGHGYVIWRSDLDQWKAEKWPRLGRIGYPRGVPRKPADA